jgi:SprT protein
MPATEHPMQALTGFLPEGSFDLVTAYLHRYKVHLTITRQRKSVLGDYRHAGFDSNHRISINGNLNKYEFLITLLHELAHLLTYELHKHRVEPHGKEWKAQYSRLLFDFVEHKIFPPIIEKALQKSIRNPAATANGETALLLILRQFDPVKKEGYLVIADIPEGSVFQTENGKLFRKGELRRKRFACVEIKTGLQYSFSPISEVKLVK